MSSYSPRLPLTERTVESFSNTTVASPNTKLKLLNLGHRNGGTSQASTNGDSNVGLLF